MSSPTTSHIPEDERDRLLLPKRAIVVSCPIHMDDGTHAVFRRLTACSII